MTGASRPRLTIFVAHPSDLLTDHIPNGDGMVAHGFIRELAARGHRMHIAVRRVELRETLPANVTLHPIRSRFANPLLDRLHYMLAIRRLLARLRREERIDVVHQMNPVFIGLSLGLVGCGLPVVLGTYVARWPGGEATSRRRGRLVRTASSAARWSISLLQQLQADALLLTTRAAYNRVAIPALVRRRIVLVGHGIDETDFAPPSGPRPDAAPAILFYAHLERRKGVFTLLEAFPKVVARVPDCRLVLAGRGDDADEVGRLVAASGLADRIELTGPLARADAPALMRAHSLYCLPSFGEPYGMTALEAMACGCALVVTDIGGLSDLVPAAGGLQCPPGDPDALADALVALLRSPSRQAAMGAFNRAHVERHLTWGRVTDQLEQVYAAVATNRSPTRRPAAAGSDGELEEAA